MSKRWPITAAGAALFLLASCASPTGEAEPEPEPPAETTSAAPAPERVEDMYEIEDRALFLSCSGSGEPTVVLEGGEGNPSEVLDPVRSALEPAMRVCAYDRANVGRSGSAPTPRTAEDVTTDLRSLLEAAEVSGPYLLIGQSAGGLLVQHHARAVPNDIVGVVAMNPVPLVDGAEKHMYPLITEPERTAEDEYYDGANGESLDYRASTEQIRAHPVPADVAFHTLISTIKQCGFAGDICGRGYPGYEAAMQEIADEWPDGQYSQSEADHEIFAEDMSAVLNAVNDVLTRAGYPPVE